MYIKYKDKLINASKTLFFVKLDSPTNSYIVNQNENGSTEMVFETEEERDEMFNIICDGLEYGTKFLNLDEY